MWVQGKNIWKQKVDKERAKGHPGSKGGELVKTTGVRSRREKSKEITVAQGKVGTRPKKKKEIQI